METRLPWALGVLLLAAVACANQTSRSAASSASPSAASPSALPSPTPSPLAAPKDCRPDGTSLKIAAEGVSWVSPTGKHLQPGQACLAAPAGKPFTLTLQNDVKKKNETFPTTHNLSIYRDQTLREPLFTGGNVSFGQSKTYRVHALDPGVYFFQCDHHRTYMTGVFVVE